MQTDNAQNTFLRTNEVNQSSVRVFENDTPSIHFKLGVCFF